MFAFIVFFFFHSGDEGKITKWNWGFVRKNKNINLYVINHMNYMSNANKPISILLIKSQPNNRFNTHNIHQVIIDFDKVFVFSLFALVFIIEKGKKIQRKLWTALSIRTAIKINDAFIQFMWWYGLGSGFFIFLANFHQNPFSDFPRDQKIN